MALRTTCIKNVKFKVIKIRTGCQYVACFYYSENLNWAAQNLRLGHTRPEGRGLDIAALKLTENLEFLIVMLICRGFVNNVVKTFDDLSLACENLIRFLYYFAGIAG